MNWKIWRRQNGTLREELLGRRRKLLRDLEMLERAVEAMEKIAEALERLAPKNTGESSEVLSISQLKPGEIGEDIEWKAYGPARRRMYGS